MGNNGIWALEKHPMEFLYGYSVAAELRPATRYDEVVAALGGHGELVERPADLQPALERAFAAGRPALVNVLTDPAVGVPAQVEPGLDRLGRHPLLAPDDGRSACGSFGDVDHRVGGPRRHVVRRRDTLVVEEVGDGLGRHPQRAQPADPLADGLLRPRAAQAASAATARPGTRPGEAAGARRRGEVTERQVLRHLVTGAVGLTRLGDLLRPDPEREQYVTESRQAAEGTARRTRNCR